MCVRGVSWNISAYIESIREKFFSAEMFSTTEKSLYSEEKTFFRGNMLVVLITYVFHRGKSLYSEEKTFFRGNMSHIMLASIGGAAAVRPSSGCCWRLKNTVHENALIPRLAIT